MRRIQLTQPATRWFLISCAVLCAVTAAALHIGLRLNLTPSLPLGVYRTADGEIEPGAVVLACLPDSVAGLAVARGYIAGGRPMDAERVCPGGTQPLGKLVLAVAGDTVEVREAGLQVNGRRIPRTSRFPLDSQGRPVPRVAEGVHVVHTGDLWLIATIHQRSFDSRYFGPVPTANVLSVIRPVWLWWGENAAQHPFGLERERPTFARRTDGR